MSVIRRRHLPSNPVHLMVDKEDRMRGGEIVIGLARRLEDVVAIHQGVLPMTSSMTVAVLPAGIVPVETIIDAAPRRATFTITVIGMAVAHLHAPVVPVTSTVPHALATLMTHTMHVVHHLVAATKILIRMAMLDLMKVALHPHAALALVVRMRDPLMRKEDIHPAAATGN